MRIIRRQDMKPELRPDGREVCYYTPFDVPPGTSQIGFISVQTPQGCYERTHRHPQSTEIFYHITPGKVMVNGTTYELGAGDIMVLEPGDEHRQIAGNDISIIALRIPLSNDKEYGGKD